MMIELRQGTVYSDVDSITSMRILLSGHFSGKGMSAKESLSDLSEAAFFVFICPFLCMFCFRFYFRGLIYHA